MLSASSCLRCVSRWGPISAYDCRGDISKRSIRYNGRRVNRQLARRLQNRFRVKVERVLRDHHECLRRPLAEGRSAPTHELEPAFDALTDAVEIDWILAARHLHPILERLAYPHLNRTIEVHRRLCHVVDDLCNLC